MIPPGKTGMLKPFFWVPSLKLTANAPENGWLEDNPFLLGRPIFRGYVSFRECILSNSLENPERFQMIPNHDEFAHDLPKHPQF